MQPGEEYKLEGAVNFRELGGYPAADGRTVRWGQLYRSGALGELSSPGDRAFLQGLGLKSVVDLRSQGEAAALPDPAVPGADMQRVCAMRFPDGSEMDFSPGGIADIDAAKREFEARLGHPVHDYDWFSELYADMPFGNPAYQLLFRLLEERKTPLLFHCSAGKDRTGIGSMLLLLALGVSEEDAVADYMLTNVYRKAHIDAFLEKVPPEQRDLLVSVEGVSRPMAEGALRAILKRYGSYEAYFEAEFGLDAARLDDLRNEYLE